MRRNPNVNRPSLSRRSHAPFVVLAISVGLIAGVLVVAVPPAGASSGWSAVPSPRPTAYGQVYLRGVSCPSTTSCFAIGSAEPLNGPTSKALVEHWNGHTWSITTTPEPTGSPGTAYLNGVFCPSPTSCFAVGYVQSGYAPNAFTTLVEHWNGHAWSIMKSPNPVGSGTPNSSLNGVSCWTTTSCFAVGNSIFHGQKTLVEHWNGNHWSIITSPDPAGSQDDLLHAVSCPSRTSCFAVGFSDAQPLVEHWNGQTWSIMTSPAPAGSYDYLSDVSCSSTASCVAVGSYSVDAVGKALAEGWNGHTWSIMTTPDPNPAASTRLNGVSCPTKTHCFAVGLISLAASVGGQGDGTVEKTRVEQWNGHSWSIMTSPNPTGSGGFGTLELNGVSCHRKASCFAVGDFGASGGRRTLTERYR